MKTVQRQARRKALARIQLARDRMARADYASAIAFLHSALKCLERDPASALDRAQCYVELARCYNLQGEYAKAVPYCRWALNLLRQEWHSDLEQAQAQMEMGFALLHLGELSQAQTLLLNAYRTFEQHEQWRDIALCAERIGLLAKQMEQPIRAINAFSYARRLYRLQEDLQGAQRADAHLRELISE